ncbi:MAG: 2-amino-4-hydroxy-6-hydroxymethyldihydropteridine diphosphokinase [Actinobacteria bacterium]|nr:2-amino-4-hydroxy-6-hydroxymethyldihydropteridine diphosphokinase [Actinomycetota bacterium]
MEALAGCGRIVAVSPLYETVPVGGPPQGPFLNAVVVLDTDDGPRRLLDACLRIERSRGRERRERWGPRTLDLDLLLHTGGPVDEPGLTVPHPRLAERRFVLAPLLDAWAEAALPDGTPLRQVAAAVAGQQIRRLDEGRWWEGPGPAAVLEAPPPDAGPADAEAAAARLYGLDAGAVPLTGDRDRTYLLSGAGVRIVLKFANPAHDPALLSMQQEALVHLAAADPGLPVPRAVPTVDGALVGSAEVGGAAVAVAAQTFLDGDRLPDGHSTPASRRSLAALLGRLDAALASFEHPRGRRLDLWDLPQLPALAGRVGHAGDLAGVLEEEIARFAERVLPALGAFPAQMIHADANQDNLLTGPGRPDDLTGIVDFGDLVEGTRAAEVGIAAAYQCLGQSDPAAVVADVVLAFAEAGWPLPDGEAALVPDLAAARLAQSLVMSSWRASLHPSNREYLLVHAAPAREALAGLRATRP